HAGEARRPSPGGHRRSGTRAPAWADQFRQPTLSHRQGDARRAPARSPPWRARRAWRGTALALTRTPSVRVLVAAREHGSHGAGNRCEYAPIGIAEVSRHAEHEERHDIDDGAAGHAEGEASRGRRSCPPGEDTNRGGKDEPKPGPKQQSRLEFVVERNERREIWTVAIGRGRIEPIPDRQNEIRAPEELPHEGRAVAEIGEGVRRKRMPPCLD